jgi:hypothetical protein
LPYAGGAALSGLAAPKGRHKLAHGKTLCNKRRCISPRIAPLFIIFVLLKKNNLQKKLHIQTFFIPFLCKKLFHCLRLENLSFSCNFAEYRLQKSCTKIVTIQAQLQMVAAHSGAFPPQ